MKDSRICALATGFKTRKCSPYLFVVSENCPRLVTSKPKLQICRSLLLLLLDVQGTASVVPSGLLAALKLVGGTLADHKFLFLGAGVAGTGIAELIALEISKQTKAPLEVTRKKLWLVDSKGLIVSSRKESLQHFKKPWAHEHEPVKGLLGAVKAIKPSLDGNFRSWENIHKGGGRGHGILQ